MKKKEQECKTREGDRGSFLLILIGME